MIWIWSVPEYFPNKRIGEYMEGTGINRFVFSRSKMINEEVVSPKIIFDCSKEYLTDVLPNSGQLIIVSKKVLAVLLEVCPKDIQVFEANIFVREKKVPDYYLVNVLNDAEVIDKEASDFSTIMDTDVILSFERIVYKTKDLGSHHLVRNRDYHSHVLVSDYLRARIKKEKITGVHFK